MLSLSEAGHHNFPTEWLMDSSHVIQEHFQGKIGVGFYNEPLTLWNALVESLGWELNVSFPVPDIPSEGGGFLAINLTNFRPVILNKIY